MKDYSLPHVPDENPDIPGECVCGGLIKTAGIHILDEVHNPSHYTTGGIECIDAIEAALTPEEASGFRKGNAIKYIWRAGLKDPAKYVEDLEKARWYLNREIEKSEAN